ncbi:hypothetical protein H0H81_007479 [Sphagnurus paluster]|uniref:AMP-dependent synthetase/ligase domain-containing protein n=1 Tax=Sphagnurus paluster TaxID=117069 RepID=A0A9P7GUI9_9AGAR|nr:hypothetical protein H0H81_007479 [Sphagnurus paluster]
MSQFYSTSSLLPHIPDDQSIPQFIFDTQNRSRPPRPDTVPWLIEDHSGRAIRRTELLKRTHDLANAMSSRWNIKAKDTVCIFSPNSTDYPVCIWAVHTLGGIITPANPAYKTDELVHQLRTANAALLVIHPMFLDTAKAAAKEVGLSENRIVFTESGGSASYPTLDELVKYGSSVPPTFTESRFKAGEARTNIAFLSFSSGTTGK